MNSEREEQRIERAGLGALPGVLDALTSRRILLVCGPSRRFVSRVSDTLAGFSVDVCAIAKRHVPRALVEAALGQLDAFDADTVVSVGGGSATGLAKALRLERDVRHVAIPTTYSGSEYTTLFGITDDGQKTTGRDPRVLPDVVLQDASLTLEMPLALSITSLVNALAHPLAVLADEKDPERAQPAALAIEALYFAIELLLVAPSTIEARRSALEAAMLAAQSIAAGTPGLHHRVVHQLGGRFDLEHGALHSVVLPHSISRLRVDVPGVVNDVCERLGIVDLEAQVFDLLTRAGAPTSLRAMGLEVAQLSELLEADSSIPGALLLDAYYGRRPSVGIRRETWDGVSVSLKGPDPSQARRVVFCVHGRGSNAESILGHAERIMGAAEGVALVAPQRDDSRWYDKRYNESRLVIGTQYEQSMACLVQAVERVLAAASADRLVLFGFSQGACLALELFVALDRPLGGVVALSGARIGLDGEQPPGTAALCGTPVVLGSSRNDPWLESADVERVAKELSELGCEVQLSMLPGDHHGLHSVHRILAGQVLSGRAPPPVQHGFGGTYQTERLPGALPRRQNSPKHVRYGLVAEQINATGFTVERAENQRSWLYRVRPSAQQAPFRSIEHPSLPSDHESRAPEVNLVGFSPVEIPSEPKDFVEGLRPIGGAGKAELRRGFALYTYAVNRSMEERAFYTADGNLLLIPDSGRVTLLTELGVLKLAPGAVALVPKGLRFSVLLEDEATRGYVAEVFGRPFRLPERGPLGANGLADARHFEVPAAWFEDRLSPGYRITAKLGGRLYEARQDYSPYDVVAWHGNYAPSVYDLAQFSPASNSLFDHGDPSLYTVLSAPLDETGSNNLDLVIFPPRWDPTEHTFRPPYFHRNATTEFNGVIRHRGQGPFVPGCYYLTPSLTPHGIRAESVNRVLRQPDAADRPARISDDSLWFQFETTLPLSLSSSSEKAPNRVHEWRAVWGGYRSRYQK